MHWKFELIVFVPELNEMTLYLDLMSMLLLAYVDKSWVGRSILRNKLLIAIICRKTHGEGSVPLGSSSAPAEFQKCKVESYKDLTPVEGGWGSAQI